MGLASYGSTGMVSRAIMQLAARGELPGRRECHARYASAQRVQGGGPVLVLALIEDLDDQADTLAVPEP